MSKRGLTSAATAGSQAWEAKPRMSIAEWHVQVFAIRQTKRRLFGGKRRDIVGYGWSASSEAGDYSYEPGPFPSSERALENASAVVAGTGGVVASNTEVLDA